MQNYLHEEMTVGNRGPYASKDVTSMDNSWPQEELRQICEDEFRESRSEIENGKKSGLEANGGVRNSRVEDEIENAPVTIRGLLSDVQIKSPELRYSGEFEPVTHNRGSFRSWSLRSLLGSFRRDNGNHVATISSVPSTNMPNSSPSPSRNPANEELENNPSSLQHGSPLSHASPMRQGSPIMLKLLTPSISFARIKEEREEKSRMVPSTEGLELKGGIKLPLIGEVRWEDLKQQIITWLKNPKNLVLLIWIIAVAVSGAILFMVMVGMLNAVLKTKSERDLWFEISNQILNALFTLMALYNHPIRILHLVYLIRYSPTDIIKLRRSYCKDGLRKPHEWAHILVVVLLLHLNCIAQYCLCGLNWGYRRSDRPAFGVAITLLVSFGAAAAAGIYTSLSPLRKDYFAEGDDGVLLREKDDLLVDKMERAEREGHSSSNHPSLFKLHTPRSKLLEKSKSFRCREGRPVPNPQWEGGVLSCYEEPTISILTTICFPCVMGFNYERLGFGNRYVHVATFLLLLGAPYMVFNLAAININNEPVRTSLGVGGAVLCVFSLLYGGFWRIKIRERYNLPAQAWCCNKPNVSDCFLWLFCSFCSLCQEVRTAEAYDVRNDTFFSRSLVKPRTSGNSPDRGVTSSEAPVPAPSLHAPPLSSVMVAPQVKGSFLREPDGTQLRDMPGGSAIFSPSSGHKVDCTSDPEVQGTSPQGR